MRSYLLLRGHRGAEKQVLEKLVQDTHLLFFHKSDKRGSLDLHRLSLSVIKG